MKTPSRKTGKPAVRMPVSGRSSSYSIGELASEFSITARAIRFYEAKGLIAPARRGSHRIYSDGDRRRLVLILRTKNLGFSLERIGDYLTLYDSAPATAGATRNFVARLDSTIGELREMRSNIDLTLREVEAIRAKCLGQRPRRGPGTP